MSMLYQNAFRGYLIDHHSPAPPTVDFANLDPAEYEAFYKEANISSLMLYTKDHWGYSYYNTAIGTKHPGLKLDYIDAISQILKKNNIEWNAYYCLEYDTLAPALHPEWAIRDKDGNAVTLKNKMAPAKWGMPCYETDYRKYVLGQLSEIVSAYHPDSLFLDIFGKTLCYCDKCKAKFFAKYGYSLPESQEALNGERGSFDFGDKGHDVNAFLQDCASEMLADIIKTLKAIDQSLKITINFAALYPKKIRDMLDYQFTEPWAGNWLSAAYSRDTAKGQYPQLGPGDVSEVYNYRPDSVYELAGAQIAANGCRTFFYSGSQHTDGTLEHTEARKVGNAFSKIKEFEHLLTNREVLADIAILQSDSSTMAKCGSDVIVNAIGRCKQPDLHREAILGAMTLCDYSKYSWQIIPEEELSEEIASKFKCIILASTFCLNKNTIKTLREYVKNGGSIIADGECGIYNLDGSKNQTFSISDLLGCDYTKIIDKYSNQDYGGYLHQDKNAVFKYLPDTFPPIGRIQYGVSLTSGEGIGKIISPCTPVTDTTWVNWWCPPPAKNDTEYNAIVKNKNIIYTAFDLFRSTNTNLNLNRNLFNGIIEQLILNPTVMLDTKYPETISYVSYTREDKIIVHVISNLAEKTNGDAPFIESGTLLLKKEAGKDYEISQVYPQKSELFKTNLKINSEEYVKIILPQIDIHIILEIKKI